MNLLLTQIEINISSTYLRMFLLDTHTHTHREHKRNPSIQCSDEPSILGK